jgi:hypothetical protein
MTPSPAPDRIAIGPIGAYIEGWRRVLRAPAVWAGLLAVGVIGALAPGMLVRARLEAYWLPFGESAFLEEIGRTIAHLRYAIPIFIDPFTGLVDVLRSASLSSALGAGFLSHAVVSLFLWGGALDRLARARRVGSAAFFAACGVYFWRFLRLAIPVAFLYWVIDRSLERYPLVETVVLIVLLVIIDYARVRAVVEDRLSIAGAVIASLRFVRRHAGPVIALCALHLATIVVLTAVGGLLIQLEIPFDASSMLAARTILLLIVIVVRLSLPASEMALFQSRLAHAEYTAAPLPMWPDSPAAEAIENLTRVGQTADGRGQKIE